MNDIPQKEKSILFTRRSVRNYTDKKVEKEKLDYILEAAMYAPSARNRRDWEFIVIDKKEILIDITKVHPYAQMLKEAPLAIIICGNIEADEGSGYWVQNASAATENILLAAKELGLSSVWLGVYPVEDRVSAIVKLFNLPKHIIPLSIAAIGYSEKVIDFPNRFEENKVHYNKY